MVTPANYCFDRWHSVIVFIKLFLALQFLELLFVLLLLLFDVSLVSLVDGRPLFILRADILLFGFVLFLDTLSFVLFKPSLVSIFGFLEVI